MNEKYSDKQTKRNNISALIATLGVALLCSCSSNTPSEKEIKSKIEDIYTNCPMMAVEDFKKINGEPQQDGSYVATLEYTLRLAPTPENKAYVEEKEKRKLELQPRYDAYTAEVKRLIQKQNTLKDQEFYNPPKSDEEYASLSASIAESEKELQYFETQHRGDAEEYDRLFAGADKVIIRNLFVSCKIDESSRSLSKIGDFIYGDPKELGKDIRRSYKGNLRMIKTDNGWMIDGIAG